MIRRRENNGAGDEVFSRRGRKFLLGWRPFRNRDISGRLNKFSNCSLVTAVTSIQNPSTRTR